MQEAPSLTSKNLHRSRGCHASLRRRSSWKSQGRAGRNPHGTRSCRTRVACEVLAVGTGSGHDAMSLEVSLFGKLFCGISRHPGPHKDRQRSRCVAGLLLRRMAALLWSQLRNLVQNCQEAVTDRETPGAVVCLIRNGDAGIVFLRGAADCCHSSLKVSVRWVQHWSGSGQNLFGPEFI